MGARMTFLAMRAPMPPRIGCHGAAAAGIGRDQNSVSS